MMKKKHADPMVVIASNRGPYQFQKDGETGEFRMVRGSGGLVTALGSLAERHEVLWVAAAMSEGDQAFARNQGSQATNVEGVSLKLLIPDQRQYAQYYNIISNPFLWFIQHQLWDISVSPRITKETWDAWNEGYIGVNRQFAEEIAGVVKDVDRPIFIFPQDYHLYMVPYFLRKLLGEKVQIQPFIHIPWPGPDAWRLLPEEMRNTLLHSLLHSDRVGFQTERDAFNFVQTCRFYLPEAHSHGSRNSVEYLGRKVEAKAYPISVDVEQIRALSDSNEARLNKSQLFNFVGDRKLILRVDRVEPSKNIVRGLEAYRLLLEMHPELRGDVQMLALLVPSRMEVGEYQDYLSRIMATAGLINAEFSDGFWEPVRILVGENYLRAIAAMQLYDVLLVNPLADGMNLVAKEGVLINQRDGVLVMSEHAGAYYELGEYALNCSPFDLYGTAKALYTALTMAPDEKKNRADALRKVVEKASVRAWFYNQAQDMVRAFASQDKNSVTSETLEAV